MSGQQQTTKSGQGVGDAIKGIFNSAHGAGETIRGTINDTLDGFGRGVAGDGSHSAKSDGVDRTPAPATSSENHGSVIENGKQEFKSGVNSMENAGK